MSRGPLIELANEIKGHVNTLTRHLDSLGLSQPSMLQGGLKAYPEDAGSQEARTGLIDALDSLRALALGPSGYFQWHVMNVKHDLSTLNMLYRFDILTEIPLNSSKTIEQLAIASNLSMSAMRRILRHAALMMILHETKPGSGRFEHTSFSAHIVKTPGGIDWLGHNIEQGAVAALRQAEAVERFEARGRQSGNSNESGMGLQFFPHKSQDYSVFDFFADDGEGARKGWRMRRFESGMAYLAHQNPEGESSSVLGGFDWDQYKGKTVLDIGGSNGHLSLKVAERHPRIRFIVNDLPVVESDFDATKAAAGPVANQLSFLAHDFFKPWPAVDFDIALMRYILHDWSDRLASKILRNLVPVLKPGTRIFVVENMVPEAGEQTTSRFMKQISSAYDFQMWTNTNGQERTLKHWIELFTAADSRFFLEKHESIPGNPLFFLTFSFEDRVL